jgi:hypothetical protein
MRISDAKAALLWVSFVFQYLMVHLQASQCKDGADSNFLRHWHTEFPNLPQSDPIKMYMNIIGSRNLLVLGASIG